MPDFPLLKTGAVTQYPMQRSLRFQTDAVKFLDGSQQKYRLFANGLRKWSITPGLLDDRELAALVTFVEEQGTAPFAFTDPATAQSVPKCVISGDALVAGAKGELHGYAQVEVEEVP